MGECTNERWDVDDACDSIMRWMGIRWHHAFLALGEKMQSVRLHSSILRRFAPSGQTYSSWYTGWYIVRESTTFFFLQAPGTRISSIFHDSVTKTTFPQSIFPQLIIYQYLVLLSNS